jgi:CRISPR-associated endonuclease/helicase Cas3
VPLRALAGSIADEVRGLERSGKNIHVAVHHGDIFESELFGEEVVVTTYDQIVCAVPGLPLSLPLSAGHAVAGALLMSRLVLDEVHLAWSISPEALVILFGILEFRQRLGLQTVLMTATMPESVAQLIATRMKMALVVAGDKETADDERLKKRNENRVVSISLMRIKDRRTDEKAADLTEVVDLLRERQGKRIYFANTPDRLQSAYDLLKNAGIDMDQVTVLHNRMPGSWRAEAEELVRVRFGKKDGPNGDWLLLTNQVAEAGLNISAPFVLSDPAPVDTLIQRAGRCARWFREQRTEGIFKVISPPKKTLKDWALPYREESVKLAQDELENILGTEATARLGWETEKRWIDAAWLGYNNEQKRIKEVEKYLDKTAFALNLFDRASQQHSPGAIASVFREIMSVQVAVVQTTEEGVISDLSLKLRSGYDLDPSSISVNRGYALISDAKGRAIVVRNRDELVIEKNPSFLAPGDLLLVPPSVAYLHKPKGLCFGDGSHAGDAALSKLVRRIQRPNNRKMESRPQSLWGHTAGVMRGVRRRLLEPGDYRSALVNILERLEGPGRARDLANVIGRLAILATGFHDLGKCGKRWQERAHEIDPDSTEELIGRTRNTAKRMGVPHTPPGFFAALTACSAALGNQEETDHLVRAIALAAARHHSSLLDPTAVRGYQFAPVEASIGFVDQVLREGELDGIDAARILDAARSSGTPAGVPLMLPNDDLFPIYALVGRAILISDREDAAGTPLEGWSDDG